MERLEKWSGYLSVVVSLISASLTIVGYLYDDKTPRNQWVVLTVLAVGLMAIVYGIGERLRGPAFYRIDPRKPEGRLIKQPFPVWGRLLLTLIPIVWMAASVWRLNIRLSLPQFSSAPLNTPILTPVPTLTATKVRQAQASRIAVAPILTPVSTLTATPHAGATYISPIDNTVMVFIPAGSFQMGSENGHGDEQPLHTVELNDYWIDRSEVTNARYALCVIAGACRPPSNISSHTRSGYYGEPQFAYYPVIYVDWNQSNAYCEWAGKRLPTEAEWEKAARGTDRRTYPWGNSSIDSDLLNFNGDVRDTTEVGIYFIGASPYGAVDMAGNVWEWVADWYDSNYYSNSPSENPTGPPSGISRVLRGGSWSTIDDFVRVTKRFSIVPANSYDDVGFRCARSP